MMSFVLLKNGVLEKCVGPELLILNSLLSNVAHLTWANKRDVGGLVLERLDRFLGNGEWLNLFLNPINYHLP